MSGPLQALRGRRVLVTGHTGFKGSWLSLWLHQLGAEVHGLALPPPTVPSLFEALQLGALLQHRVGDVRDAMALRAALDAARPELILHLAAQPLVRRSYREPLETFEVNALGTARLLEAVRAAGRPCAVLLVTSDKCYRNDGAAAPRREEDALGGDDPYSASKAAAELVAASWRASFFPPHRFAEHGVAVATARGGNVIGGGDFAEDRIVPDLVRAFSAGRPGVLRNPGHLRPFQHVVEPLAGYLALAVRLLGPEAPRFSRGWNFAPEGSAPVRALAQAFAQGFGAGASIVEEPDPRGPPEARTLLLDSSLARAQLGWAPRWPLAEAAGRSARWYRAQAQGAGPEELRALCLQDLADWGAP